MGAGSAARAASRASGPDASGSTGWAETRVRPGGDDHRRGAKGRVPDGDEDRVGDRQAALAVAQLEGALLAELLQGADDQARKWRVSAGPCRGGAGVDQDELAVVLDQVEVADAARQPVNSFHDLHLVTSDRAPSRWTPRSLRRGPRR